MSTTSQNIKKLYLDIDSLIDTRLSILNALAPNYVKCLDLDAFASRNTDVVDIQEMTPIAWRHAWKTRHEGYLNPNLTTRILEIVAERFSDYMVGEISPATIPIQWMDLNIYPYYLPDNQRDDLEALLEIVLNYRVKVRVIRKPFTEINLHFLRDNYHTAIMYNFGDFIRNLDDPSKYIQVLSTVIITPKLLENPPDFSKIEDKELLEHIEQYGIFRSSEHALNDMLTIRFIDTAFFTWDFRKYLGA